MRNHQRRGLFAFAIISGIVLTVERGATHKPITSQFTYNDDLFPILRDRCGRCHVQDGVAPMSLMTYRNAVPWGESLRAELIAGHMPPWHAQEGLRRFKNAPTLTAAEVDKLLTWASGGTPEGNPLKAPPAVALQRGWPLGQPDLVLPLSPEAIVAAGTSETTQEFTVATRATESKWIQAVDLLPGTPSIVRDAIISVKADAAADAAVETVPGRVLAMWVPGEDPVAAAGGEAFRLPAGAELTVRVHYKKTYQYENKPMTDRSSVGLYFAQRPSNEIRRLDVASPPVLSKGSTPLSFSRTVNEDLQVLAVSPDPALSNASLQVDAVTPDGIRTPVIRLAVRPNWARRYWFDQPIALPRGTRIEVVAVLDGADAVLPPAGTPTPPQLVDGSPVRVMFDVVRMGAPRFTNQ